jgi:hypothetical protein
MKGDLENFGFFLIFYYFDMNFKLPRTKVPRVGGLGGKCELGY